MNLNYYIYASIIKYNYIKRCTLIDMYLLYNLKDKLEKMHLVYLLKQIKFIIFIITLIYDTVFN